MWLNTRCTFVLVVWTKCLRSLGEWKLYRLVHGKIANESNCETEHTWREWEAIWQGAERRIEGNTPFFGKSKMQILSCTTCEIIQILKFLDKNGAFRFSVLQPLANTSIYRYIFKYFLQQKWLYSCSGSVVSRSMVDKFHLHLMPNLCSDCFIIYNYGLARHWLNRKLLMTSNSCLLQTVRKIKY